MRLLGAALAAALARHAGGPVTITHRSPLSGGSINRLERLETSAGSFVLKSHPEPPPRFFQAEAEGLLALAESGASLLVPRVIAVGDEATPFLLLEHLPPAERDRDTDVRIGRGLAELHQTTAARYGFAADNYCGSTLQPNAWRDSWIDFYRTARLGYQVRLARDAGLLDSDTAARLDRVVARLDAWLTEPAEGPSLVHGDLWAGNLHITIGGQPALLDPAAYFGHREAELGMMGWFGGFSARVYDAYDDAFPLESGWRERSPLYRLYHVLNHVNLFGGSYLSDALSIASRFS
ncbi:MAG: fructosamine kinase family protein [Acidobacteria bacterium]|nr:fructosamine kinase family protein [Acidobacteriota bacterium]